jgi:hypothetical protein
VSSTEAEGAASDEPASEQPVAEQPAIEQPTIEAAAPSADRDGGEDSFGPVEPETVASSRR